LTTSWHARETARAGAGEGGRAAIHTERERRRTVSKHLLKASLGVALIAAAAAAFFVPLAGAKPAPSLSASASGSTASANCATYGAVSGKIKWSGAPVDKVTVEVGSNSGGLVGTVYGSQTLNLAKAKSNGFFNYSIPASGTMDILPGTDVAVVAKFSSGGIEYPTVAFKDLGVCSGLPDLVITSLVFVQNNQDGSKTWNVTVQNNGTADAVLDASVTIQAYWTNNASTSPWPPLPSGGNPPTAGGDPACGTSFAPTYNTTLQPGHSTAVPITCPAAPSDLADIWLALNVDNDNVVAESNENNNVASYAIGD
jgi:hypothetical protein